jgi:hypothetical protein
MGIRSLLTISFLFTISFYAKSQSLDDYRQTQDKIHTIYLYNFSRYFVWPTTAISNENFVIGIMGDHSITDELNNVASTKTVGGKSILVRTYQKPEEIDSDCHIVFIPYESSFQLSEVLSITRDKPILVVSCKPGLGQFGSLLNFVAYQGKITFEINEEAIQNRKLKFAQQIKAIGRPL